MREKFYKLVKKILLKIYGCQMPQINSTPSAPEGEFRITKKDS